MSSNSKVIQIFGNIATTDEEIIKGLMFRKKKLRENEGLLFDMNENKIHKFWMKNTYIPLDIIFLNSKLRILGYIENAVPLSLELLSINKKSSYIIETNGGFIKENKVKINDYIDFKIIKKCKKCKKY